MIWSICVRKVTYSGISDRSENVESGQSAKRIDRVQGSAKSLMKDVADASTTAKLCSFNVVCRTFNGGTVGRSKLGDDLQ